MTCNKCGAQISDNAKFCAACGAEVIAEAPETTAVDAVEAPTMTVEEPTAPVAPVAAADTAAMPVFRAAEPVSQPVAAVTPVMSTETSTPVVFDLPETPRKKVKWKPILLPLAGLLVIVGILAFVFYPQVLKMIAPARYVAYANQKTEDLLEKESEAMLSDLLGVKNIGDFNSVSLTLNNLSMTVDDAETQALVDEMLSAYQLDMSIQTDGQKTLLDLLFNGESIQALDDKGSESATIKLPGMDYALLIGVDDWMKLYTANAVSYDDYGDYDDFYGTPEVGNSSTAVVSQLTTALIEKLEDVESVEDLLKAFGIKDKHLSKRSFVNKGSVRLPNIDNKLTQMTTTVNGSEFKEMLLEIINGDLVTDLLEMSALETGMTVSELRATAVDGINALNGSVFPTLEISVYVNDKHQSQAVSFKLSMTNSALAGLGMPEFVLEINAGFNGKTYMTDSFYVNLNVTADGETNSVQLVSTSVISDEKRFYNNIKLSYKDSYTNGLTEVFNIDTRLENGALTLSLYNDDGGVDIKGAVEGSANKMVMTINEIVVGTGNANENITMSLELSMIAEKTTVGELKIDGEVKPLSDLSDEELTALGETITEWLESVGLYNSYDYDYDYNDYDYGDVVVTPTDGSIAGFYIDKDTNTTLLLQDDSVFTLTGYLDSHGFLYKDLTISGVYKYDDDSIYLYLDIDAVLADIQTIIQQLMSQIAPDEVSSDDDSNIFYEDVAEEMLEQFGLSESIIGDYDAETGTIDIYGTEYVRVKF